MLKEETNGKKKRGAEKGKKKEGRRKKIIKDVKLVFLLHTGNCYCQASQIF